MSVTTLNMLDALNELKREMVGAGRSREAGVLREALTTIANSARDLVPIEEAARQFDFPVEWMLGWIQRGGWDAREIEGKWFVTAQDLQTHLETRDMLRDAFTERDKEGYPTREEILELYARPRRRSARIPRAANRS